VWRIFFDFPSNRHTASGQRLRKAGQPSSQILGFQTCMFGNLLQHDRADFNAVMECPGEIREPGPHELTMRAAFFLVGWLLLPADTF
jgi:hypothetical protein